MQDQMKARKQNKQDENLTKQESVNVSAQKLNKTGHC